jgi:hypothetical protein
MSTATRRAIYGKLSGDTTLTALLAAAPTGYSQNIFYQSGPDSAQFPLVILSKQSGVPTQAFHDPTALDTEIWLVKAVDHNSSADPAEAIQARLKTLLNDATLSIGGGATLLHLRRESDVDYQEITSGESYIHAGSLFRLVLDP